MDAKRSRCKFIYVLSAKFRYAEMILEELLTFRVEKFSVALLRKDIANRNQLFSQQS